MRGSNYRRATTDEKRIAENRKLDYIEKLGLTPEQRKTWDRKPYGMGDKKNGMQSQ